MSREGVDEPPLTYQRPVDFGQPQEQAEEQATEPFYWQYPTWARPGYHLYYYQDYGYFDHPLYTIETPDGGKLVVSYGNGQCLNKPHMAEPSETPWKRPKLEMVDVYYNDEFVEEVQLRLLIRFSSVASVTFSEMKKKTGARGGSGQRGHGQTAKRTSRHGTIVDLVMDSASQDIKDASLSASRDSSPAASPNSTASETWWSARGRSDTRTTELTIPEEFKTPRNESSRSQHRHHRHRRHTGETHGKKELRLNLNVPEMPTRKAFREAISWMKSNEQRHGDQTLLYGPDDLEKLSLEDMIDLYQAALAFGMQPWPGRLKLELNERITRTRVDFKTFRNITRWLPLADSCLARAINQLDYHLRRADCADAEVELLEVFVSQPDNEALRARIHELHIVRGQAQRAESDRRQDQTKTNGVRKSAQDITQHQNNCREMGGDEKPESTQCQPSAANDSHDHSPRRHRRRPRRKRQSEGKALNGIAIPFVHNQ